MKRQEVIEELRRYIPARRFHDSLNLSTAALKALLTLYREGSNEQDIKNMFFYFFLKDEYLMSLSPIFFRPQHENTVKNKGIIIIEMNPMIATTRTIIRKLKIKKG